MKTRVYLISLDIAGIKSLEESIHLDFYKKTIDKTFNIEGYRIKGIYGENGSGKTSIITGVKLLQGIILSSIKLGDSDKQRLLNKSGELRVLYHYQFSIAKNILGEYYIEHELMEYRLTTSPNTKYRPIFECAEGEAVYIDAEEAVRSSIIEESKNMLFNQSFLSVVLLKTASGKIKTPSTSRLWEAVLNAFLFSFKTHVYLPSQDNHDDYIMYQSYDERKMSDEDYVNRYLKDYFMRKGSGLHQVLTEDFDKYKKKIKGMSKFLKLFKPMLKTIDIEDHPNGTMTECRLFLNYGDYRVDEEFESAGIKKLMSLYDYFDYAANDDIVFIDEMDANINDIYLARLVEFFGTYGEGQLCFTVHNLGPMDVLNEWNKSIDFLTIDNRIVPWKKTGNSSPVRAYRGGMIDGEPFNIFPSDFVGILGD